MKTKKIKQLKKELSQTCPICQSIYQLLEIHYSLSANSELLKGKCLNNCLDKWQRTLNEHYSKEIMSDIAKKDNQ